MGLFLVQAGSSSSKVSAEAVVEVGARINFAFPARLFSSNSLVQASSSCATTSKVPAGTAMEAIGLAPVVPSRSQT